MKKVVCIILTLAIMLTFCVIGVSAKGKIADSLQAKMDAAEEYETIRVIIWLYNPVDNEEVFRQAIKECGYIGGLPLNMTQEEVDAYRMIYNRIVFEQEAAAVNSFIEAFSLDEACINETYCLCINANLTKAQIEAAAAYNEVEGIYFDDEGLPIEPIENNIDYPAEQREEQFRDLCTRAVANAEVTAYSELYYHTDVTGDCDWILVYGCSNVQAPMELATIIGNRVILLGSCGIPFDSNYGVYDVKNDTFVDAQSAARGGYADFVKVFDELGGGRLIGDLDRDNELSVIDVTIIQRCEVNIREYPADDEIKVDDGLWRYSVKYYSDFDRDGERTILDATRLQRYLISE